VTIAAGSDRIQTIGFVEGRFVPDGSGVEGWLTGWSIRPMAIHIPSASVFRTPVAMRTLRLVPVSGDRLAVVTFATTQLKASLYAPLTADAAPVEPIAQNRTSLVRP